MFRASGFTCLSLVVIIIFALLFLTIEPGERLLKSVAETQLRALLKQDVRIGTIETNLISCIRINDIRIYEDRDGAPAYFIKSGYLKLDYNLPALVRRKIAITQLTVDSLMLFVRRDSLGKFNFPVPDSAAPPAEEPQTPGFTFEIDDLKISHSYLQYQDQQIPLNASIYNLHFASTFQHKAYTYALEMDSLNVAARQLPVTASRVEVRGNWCAPCFRVDTLSMKLLGLDLDGNLELTEDSTSTRAAGILQLNGELENAAVRVKNVFPPQLQPASGTISAVCQLSGTLSRPQLSLVLQAPALRMGDYRANKIEVNAAWNPDTLHLRQLQVNVANGQIAGAGIISSDTLAENRLQLQIRDLHLGYLWRLQYREASPFKGRISGDLAANGKGLEIDRWTALLRLSITELIYNARQLPEMSARIDLKKDHAEFRFTQAASVMSAEALLNGEDIEAAFDLKMKDISALAGLFNIHELNGEIAGSGTFSLKNFAPEVHADVIGRKLSYQNFPVDTLLASFRFNKNKLFFHQLHFTGQQIAIDTANAPFHLSGLTGGFHYQGKGQGLLDTLQAQLELELAGPAYAQFRFDHGSLRGELRQQHIRLTSFELLRDSLALFATGGYRIPSAEGNIDLTCFSDDFAHSAFETDSAAAGAGSRFEQHSRNACGDIALRFNSSDMQQLALAARGTQLNLAALAGFLPDTTDAKGMLDFNLDFRGSPAKPQADLALRIRKPAFNQAEFDSITANAAVKNDSLLLHDLSLYVANHHSQANASVELEKNDTLGYSFSAKTKLKGSVEGQAFDLRLIQPFLPEGMLLSGFLQYEIKWDGSVGKPQIRGTLRLNDGTVIIGPDQPAIQQINANISIQDSTVVIDDISGIAMENPWRLHGTLSAEQWRKFDLHLNLVMEKYGKIDWIGSLSPDSLKIIGNVDSLNLKILEPFVSGLSQLSGTCNSSFQISGVYANPQIDGNFETRNLAFSLPELNTAFRQGVLKIAFDKQKVTIDSIYAKINDGNFFMSGYLIHDTREISDIQINAAFDKIKVAVPKTATVLINSARLKYARMNAHYQLDGDILLGESRVIYNLRPQNLLELTRASEAPSQELPEFIRKTRMNVRLRESEHIWIDNNLARLRLHPELSVIGNLLQPNLTGRLSAEEGYVLYLDRKFQVNQAIADFIDPNQINPILDVTAVANIKSYQILTGRPYVITLSIKGPLNQAIVELTSEPALDKSDIIALLTIGATRDQLISKDAGIKEANISEVLRDRIEVLSSQRISGYASRKVGNMLGLEKMTIEGNLFQFGRSWGPQLLASKKISERVEITYITTVGHFNENNIRLDYRLSRRFSLQGQTDREGHSSLDLKYRLQFK